jgi:sugar phosphate permease
LLQVRVLGRSKQIFYGWVIVAGGFVNQVFNSGLGFQGFGTFIVPLEQEFGWSKTALSAARSFMQIENGLMGPVEGVVVDRFGPRVIMGIGMFIFGLGLFLLGFIHSLWSYYVVFVIMALGTSLGGFLVMSVSINNWFRRKRTLAMSLAQTGLGFGGIIVIPLLIWAQGEFGWRIAAMGAGVSVWAIGLPASLLMRHTPERYGALPDGDPPAPPEQQASVATETRAKGGGDIDFTLREAIRTPAFWLIGIGHGLSIMVITAVAVHQFAHMEQGVHIARSSAAVVVIVLSAMNIVGRLVGGVLGDRYDKRYMAAIGMAGAAAALFILAIANSLAQTMAFGVIYGFFWGIRGPMMNSIRGEYFGRASFGKIAGTSSLITMPFSMFGPIFTGFMADTQGDYIMGFIILSVVSALGSILFLLTRPPSLPARFRAPLVPQVDTR